MAKNGHGKTPIQRLQEEVEALRSKVAALEKRVASLEGANAKADEPVGDPGGG